MRAKVMIAAAVAVAAAVAGYMFARRGAAGLLAERYELQQRIAEMKVDGFTAAENKERALANERIKAINAELAAIG